MPKPKQTKSSESPATTTQSVEAVVAMTPKKSTKKTETVTPVV